MSHNDEYTEQRKATESGRTATTNHMQKQAIRTTCYFSSEILKVRELRKRYFKFQKTITSNADHSSQGKDLSRFKDN